MVAHKNSAQQEETCPTSPLGLSARSHVAHQLTSSSTLDRSRYLRSQISSGYIATRLHRHSASAPGATLLILMSSSTLDRSRYLRSQISSGYIATRLHRHSASAPGATLLTFTSSSTLDRSRYLKSQNSLGYIATRPQRPEPRCSS